MDRQKRPYKPPDLKNKAEYKHYTNISKELLDSIKVGDYVKVNNWKRPLKVKAVSKNYFVMAMPCFGKSLYSICCKLPIGKDNNEYCCSTDFWSFGHPLTMIYEDVYSFDNLKANQKYLKSLEEHETKLSYRNLIVIKDLFIKSI